MILSSPQAVHNIKYDRPILTTIYALRLDLIKDGKEVVYVWLPGHVGISGNLAADSAAKDALDGDVSDEYIPFSDLKPRLNNYSKMSRIRIP